MLIDQLKAAGMTLPEGIETRFDFERMQDYLDFLYKNQERFFSKADQERILERHLFECLIFVDYVASALNVSRETRVADAGTGPGLPGFLFGCLKDAPGLTLIDSSARSLGLLEEHIKGRQLPVRFRFERLEEMRGQFHLITTRALFGYPSVIELICHLQEVGDHFTLSGADLSIDNPRIKNYLSTLGYVSRETIEPDELKFLGSRKIYVFRKEKQTKKGYPRKWKVIKNSAKDFS